MSTGEIAFTALLHGLAMSVALATVIGATLRWNAEMWLGDYPPDIREAFGPMSRTARRQRAVTGVLLGVVLLGALGLGLVWLHRADASPEFFDVALYVFVLLTTFNLFDLLVLDWLWFVRLRPSFIVLPGTEGMAGYDDDGFHFRAFLTGIAGSIALALLIASGAAALRWLGS
ncbi:MAG: hypothetical protein R3266_10830 [Gemmatimonadota bacterium]|nr:hypothetical protein [Gemmatimonadota bacterium]